MSKKQVYFRILLFLIVSTLFLGSCSSPGDPFPTGKFSYKELRHYEFFDDGTWTWGEKFDEPMIKGSYKVKGNIITFHSVTMINGSLVGCGDNEGEYTWVYEDEVLSFEKLTDTCGPRRADNSWDYTLVKEIQKPVL